MGQRKAIRKTEGADCSCLVYEKENMSRWLLQGERKNCVEKSSTDMRKIGLN